MKTSNLNILAQLNGDISEMERILLDKSIKKITADTEIEEELILMIASKLKEIQSEREAICEKYFGKK